MPPLFPFISFFKFRNLVFTFWWRKIESFASQTLGSELNKSLSSKIVIYFISKLSNIITIISHNNKTECILYLFQPHQHQHFALLQPHNNRRACIWKLFKANINTITKLSHNNKISCVLLLQTTPNDYLAKTCHR